MKNINPLVAIKGLLKKKEKTESPGTGGKIKHWLGIKIPKIPTFGKKAPAPAPAPELPGQPKHQAEMVTAATQANERAFWAIQYATEHPEDRVAQKAAEEATTYLSRVNRLRKDKKQYWNAAKVAERYLQSDLTTQAGQEKYKRESLDRFNQQFDINLDQRQYDKFYDLTQTDSYKKMLEKHNEKYREVIQMVSDAYEDEKNPLQMEKALDLLVKIDVDPDIETFAAIMELQEDQFSAFYREAMDYADETMYADDLERKDAIEGILGRYTGIGVNNATISGDKLGSSFRGV